MSSKSFAVASPPRRCSLRIKNLLIFDQYCDYFPAQTSLVPPIARTRSRVSQSRQGFRRAPQFQELARRTADCWAPNPNRGAQSKGMLTLGTNAGSLRSLWSIQAAKLRLRKPVDRQHSGWAKQTLNEEGRSPQRRRIIYRRMRTTSFCEDISRTEPESKPPPELVELDTTYNFVGTSPLRHRQRARMVDSCTETGAGGKVLRVLVAKSVKNSLNASGWGKANQHKHRKNTSVSEMGEKVRVLLARRKKTSQSPKRPHGPTN